MGRPKKNPPVKKRASGPQRQGLHFIPDWAEKRGLKPTDFITALNVDKSSVSRWFNGRMPDETNLPRIAAFLEIEVADLFRRPDDDWLRRLFYNRSVDELKRMRDTLEAAFPRKLKAAVKDGTDG